MCYLCLTNSLLSLKSFNLITHTSGSAYGIYNYNFALINYVHEVSERHGIFNIKIWDKWKSVFLCFISSFVSSWVCVYVQKFLLDAVRHEFAFRNCICCRPVTLLQKDSISDVLLVFSLCYTKSLFFGSSCLIVAAFLYIALVHCSLSYIKNWLLKLLKTLERRSNENVRAPIKCILALFLWGERVSTNMAVYRHQNAMDTSVPKAGYILKFEAKQNEVE